MPRTYDVLIVGGGPVGVALALDLGLRGVSCALIERRTGMTLIPKGQNLTQRTLEHFHFWGVEPQIRAARLMPPGYPIGEFTAYGNLTSSYWYTSAGREVVRPYYFQDNERLPQYRTEEVLRARLAQIDCVDTRLGWSAQSPVQDADGVRMTIREDATGTEEQLEGRYLVGCDGGRSMVREAAGIGRGGTDFDARMALIVFRSRELHEKLLQYPQRSTYRVMHPRHEGYWQFFGRIDVGEGWFFHAPVPDDAGDDFDFKQLLFEAAGFEFDCTFDSVGFWDLRVAVAENYQVGRIFIAGDAAHTHPPYGGFGLNNGLEDATNLGWKIAAAVQSWGSEALLASYTQERRPIFHETAEDFIAARIRADGEFLATWDPARDRDAFERKWAERSNESGTRAQQYEPNYEGSRVIAGPPGGICSAHGEHMIKARAGHHLTPRLLSTGANTFDHLGLGFTLFAFDVSPDIVAAFETAAADLQLPLTCVTDTYADARTAYEAHLILVRPDQYVVWTADAPPSDPRAILAQSVGR